MRLSTLLVPFACMACGADRSVDALTPPATDSGYDGSGGFEVGLDAEPAEAGCATSQSQALAPPVDLIFAIDQSESMDAEIDQVKKNINKLSDLLAATKLDYRVIMIARPGPDAFGVCIPAPLGAEGCGDNLPRFKRSAQQVASNDALALYLRTYDSTDPLIGWSKYVRPTSVKVFVPITDDNATQPPPAPYWKTFDTEILKRGAGAFGKASERNYVFYPIVGASAADPTKKCAADVVDVGTEYLELTKLTGGRYFPICATDYGPIFLEMGRDVVEKVVCRLPIPKPAAGETLDPTKVNVSYTPPGGKPTELLQDNSKPCDGGANGWQYSADRTRILLCGEACDAARDNPGAKVDVIFGCTTRVR